MSCILNKLCLGFCDFFVFNLLLGEARADVQWHHRNVSEKKKSIFQPTNKLLSPVKN